MKYESVEGYVRTRIALTYNGKTGILNEIMCMWSR
jgi:hypothetical protein